MNHMKQAPFFYGLIQLLGAASDYARSGAAEKPVFLEDPKPIPKPVPDLRDMLRQGVAGPLFVAFDFERSPVPELAHRLDFETTTVTPIFDQRLARLVSEH